MLIVAAAAVLGWVIARSGLTRTGREEVAPVGSHGAGTVLAPMRTAGRAEQPLPPARLVELDRMARRFVAAQRRKSGTHATSAGAADVNIVTRPTQTIAGKEVTDPIARVALIYVGVDPEAEAYWFDAINDPSLSANERQDLIEDLNEEGFADPHHPTIDDLPLIVSRLELIEELAADAMDEVNSDAFAEAHKDLVRMAQIAQQEIEE